MLPLVKAPVSASDSICTGHRIGETPHFGQSLHDKVFTIDKPDEANKCVKEAIEVPKSTHTFLRWTVV